MDELERVKEKEFRHNFRMICLSVIDQKQPLDSPFFRRYCNLLFL
nr:MAG TPA: hypothetical protein [Caudoviricetes sp.]